MSEEENDELGSRCIYCGEPFLAHVKGDWCSSEEEANTVTNTPVDLSINDLKISVAPCPPPAASNVFRLAKRL